MQEKSIRYAEIREKLQANDWINFKRVGLDRTEAALIIELLEKRQKELDRQKKRYENNREERQKESRERYYANKLKINEGRKKQYVVSKLEVFKK